MRATTALEHNRAGLKIYWADTNQYWVVVHGMCRHTCVSIGVALGTLLFDWT
jgi:hypothetical protein